MLVSGKRQQSGVRSIVVAITALWLALVFGSVPALAAKVPFSAIAVDARTGKIIFSSDPDGYRHPASLTKMMTLYVLFQDLKAGRIKLNSPLRISARAASMSPSKLGVKPGTTITVDTAIRAIVIISANDVASAVGENLGGSEQAFAARMTKVARALGMSHTTFRNSSGLPNPDQWTSARDMATLGLRLQRDFPEYYPYFSLMSFTYAGHTTRTHNRLLGKYEGADGIKTGYVAASGFNLTSSAIRDGRRLVGVVLGARSGASRNIYMMRMLDNAFPKAKVGRTIVAMAGSPKGATQEGAATAPKPLLKPVAAKPDVTDDAKDVAAAQPQAADGANDQGDGNEDGDQAAAAPATGTTLKTVIAGTDSPKVIEGEIGAKPKAKLPFQVKPEAKQADVDAATVASLPAASWTIQIGAYANKADAIARLQKLRAAGPLQVRDKPGFTVTVQKGADTSYRARFSGLTEKQAKEACRQISAKSLACYVVGPES